MISSSVEIRAQSAVRAKIPSATALRTGEVVFELLGPGDRLRTMILVAGFGGLRYGVFAVLRRRHYDASKGTVTIEEAIDKRGRRKDPKTFASRRTVALPRFAPGRCPTNTSRPTWTTHRTARCFQARPAAS